MCGKPLTLGVMHRVLDLADRDDTSPPGAKPFQSLIALPEILGEVVEANPGTKKVNHFYFRLLSRLGPELSILRRVPLEKLAQEAYGTDFSELSTADASQMIRHLQQSA